MCRQYLRYQQAEIIYSISHKKLFELASDAGAIYRIDGTVLINRDIFDTYLERFHEMPGIPGTFQSYFFLHFSNKKYHR